jgi:hypothetical protein
MIDFLQRSAGKWLSQRTCYHLPDPHHWHQSAKITFFQTELPGGAEAVVRLCQECGVNPQAVAGTLQTHWEKGAQGAAGSSLYVALDLPAIDPDLSLTLAPEADRRFLWWVAGQGQGEGRYGRGSDSWVWVTQRQGWETEERIWFPGENFRVRYSLSRPLNPGDSVIPQGSDRGQGGIQQGAFYSEIRLGQAAP